ncbi:VOC family protein [Phytohabitans kaempferiae]|uniref:VOC family protein n=1 Tax=Phytohabitans kaempferiae TaxID=1620943 RepID=A0ABV6LYF3_9ACTN
MNDIGIVRLSHVGFAVGDIDEFRGTWGAALGITSWAVREITQEPGTTKLRGAVAGPAFSRIAFARLADTSVELVEPHHGETRTALWLAEHGPGIHHLAFWVADLTRALHALGDSVEVTYSPVDVASAAMIRGTGALPTVDDVAGFWAYTEHHAADVPWCLELLDARRAGTLRATFGDHLVYPDTPATRLPADAA